MLNKLKTLKDNPRVLTSVIILAFVILFDTAVVIFDIVQIVIASVNSARLSSAFVVLNVIMICVSLLAVVLCVLMLVLKPKQISSNHKSK